MKKIIFTALIFFYTDSSKSPICFHDCAGCEWKVVFQQFIHIDQEFSNDQRYALLYKWGKDNYARNLYYRASVLMIRRAL